MCVCAEIVRDEIAAHLKELRDWLAMIPGHSGREVLRGFDAAGGSFNGQTGNGNGRSRPAWIGVKNIPADDHPLRGVRIHKVDVLNVGSNRYRFRL